VDAQGLDPIATIPVVVVSSFWEGSNVQAGNPETITSVTLTGFTVTSGNWQSNYYLNYIAVAS
jgi:hypothetical protein